MSPHPYRLAISCLDTLPPVEPVKKPRVPIEALVIACALVSAASAIATLRAVAQQPRVGHVELGPAALARLRTPKPKPVHPPRHEEPTAVAQAPLLRGGTHDPKTILATAKQLEALGVDLTVAEVQVAKPLTARSDAILWPARFIPVHGPSGHMDGVELRGIPRESPLRAAGFGDGDQVLSIDGYDLADETIGSLDTLRTRNRGWSVVEIARGDHHVVLSIRWPVP